ncbi:MAG: hypothetical protein A2Z18_01255 [Armatimonadetes bacterium RBG_16_58_9]|nr:MAG: hypothetical protein A2Z18_01255 [Armatimonadetes bacterium RBG_16_58_9]
MLSTTRLLLESRGFGVATAANGEDGMRKLEECRPDVVLLDVMMPDRTEGFHWLYALRRNSDEVIRSVPVIIVSSIHDTTDLRFHEGDSDETGNYLPAQGFLDKPVDPDELACKIELVLAEAG